MASVHAEVREAPEIVEDVLVRDLVDGVGRTVLGEDADEAIERRAVRAQRVRALCLDLAAQQVALDVVGQGSGVAVMIASLADTKIPGELRP